MIMADNSSLKARFREAWHEAWDKGNVNAFDDLLAPDFTRVTHGPDAPLTADGYKAFILEIRRAFPDLVTSIDALVEDGNRLAIFWSSTGTHLGELDGVPTTNKYAKMYGSDLCTIVDGRLSHEIVTWDNNKFRSFLGIATVSHDETPSSAASQVAVGPEPELLKGFNRQFVTGVTVVSTMDGEKALGLAVNAYCSVSLDPPLVMVCIQRTSSTWPSLFRATHLGVNVLGRDQDKVLSVFASKDKDKFGQIEWQPGPHGSPLVSGSAAMLEAEIQERFQAKTHTIFVCRVRYAEVGDAAPMVYKAGKFFDGAQLTELLARS